MKIAVILVATVASSVAAALAAALALSRFLKLHAFEPRPAHYTDPLQLEVVDVGAGTISLRNVVRWPIVGAGERGEYGLATARGWGAVGPVLNTVNGVVTRAYRPVSGEIRPGDHARLDPFGWWADPAEAHGYAFEEVSIECAPGPMPAWHVPGRGDTWAIMVHGKGAARREALRAMPPLVDAGHHVLAISYRNDLGCARDGAGYSYGRDEWEDLESAVVYANDRGAREIVLVGYSMGGAIVVNFMDRSPLARNVGAVVLDSPMLDLGATVAFGAGQNRIPLRLLAISNRVASRLHRFNWSDFSHLERAARIATPVLLIHGDADMLVPVSTSDALAAARSERLTYLRVPGAGHVRAWNMDPDAYHRAVAAFLSGVTVA